MEGRWLELPVHLHSRGTSWKRHRCFTALSPALSTLFRSRFVTERTYMRDLPTPTQPLFDALPTGRSGQSARSRLPRQPAQHQTHAQAPAPAFSVAWARHQDEVAEAQRLRYKVFAEEMGARLQSSSNGTDVDMFDAYCDHLIVRDQETLRVVGTYRVLPPHQAKRVGCLYAESEFDLVRLAHLRLEDAGAGPLVRAPRLPLGQRHHGALGPGWANTCNATTSSRCSVAPACR